jgi:hypothetical protein
VSLCRDVLEDAIEASCAPVLIKDVWPEQIKPPSLT